MLYGFLCTDRRERVFEAYKLQLNITRILVIFKYNMKAKETLTKTLSTSVIEDSKTNLFWILSGNNRVPEQGRMDLPL